MNAVVVPVSVHDAKSAPLPELAGAAGEHLAGEVDRIRWRCDDNDWSVAEVVCRDSGRRVTVVGYTGCQPGQVIEADGVWQVNKPYGRQFMADRIVALSPTTLHGLASYLGSGALPGVGKKISLKMVEHFGMDLLTVLDEAPERLSDIRGIGPTKAARVAKAWKAHAAIREIMLFLHSQGLSTALCRRVHKVFGDDAVNVIKHEPYRLCMDVRGIGFKTADAIALNLAIPHGSEQRVVAGMVYEMSELTSVGHCGCLRDAFVERCADMLETPADRVVAVLDEQLALPPIDRRFVEHEGAVYPASLARAEQEVAALFQRASAGAPRHAKRVTRGLIESAARSCGMDLADKQALAVWTGLTRKVSVITGGPGCGKTATLNVLLAAFAALRLSVSLVAPTGKAAQRAREATGREARTIHRLLGIRGIDDDGDSEIHADVVVIDEMSMVDIPLMRRVATALRDTTTLVLVGDVDQLPSVGPGRVLADLIDSRAVPVTVLDKVFRQAAGSAIITNAHAINHAQVPVSAGRDGDFFVLTEDNTPVIARALRVPDDERAAAVARAVADNIEQLVATRVPATYQVNPTTDIQVLAPMNKGDCGVIELNQRLQRALNPTPPQYVVAHGSRFGVGDKVLQCKNNYNLDIYNGDVGIVTGVGDDEATLKVLFDGRAVSIPEDSLDDLKLAYAMTIHKSQGSQAPVVIIPMVTQHWALLQRNLLYTGVTRASRICILVGQKRALSAAVRRIESTRRVTRLKSLLQVASDDSPPAVLGESDDAAQ